MPSKARVTDTRSRWLARALAESRSLDVEAERVVQALQAQAAQRRAHRPFQCLR